MFLTLTLIADAPPPPIASASSVYAHSKGVLLTNQSTGFWFIHSVPEWPQTRAQVNTTERKGQKRNIALYLFTTFFLRRG